MASISDTTEAWWLLYQQDENPGGAVIGAVNDIRNESSYRRQMWQRAAQVYGTDLKMFGMPTKNIWDERVNFNVARNAIHTMQAKLCRQMPLPSAQTVGADFLRRFRAQQLDKFMAGTFAANSYAKIYPQLILDVLVFGTAAVKVYIQDGQPVIERVPIFDLLISEVESRYGTPRCFYHRCYMDRSVVLEMFGREDDSDDESLYGTLEERRASILAAPRPQDDDSVYLNTTRHSDQILVYEATHLASGPDADDGLRVVSVNGGMNSGTLQALPWTRNKNAGLAFLKLNATLSGVFGPSMALELASAQDEYDRLSEKIQLAHNLMGGSHILVQAGTLGKTHIDNDIGTFIEYSGSEPRTFNPQPVHPDTYAYKDMIATNMLKYLGISEMAAQSTLPAGLRQASGRALTVYDDMEDARFRVAHESVQQFHVDIGWLIVDACEEAAEAGQQVEILAPGQGSLERINWSDIQMDRKEYALRCEPISALSQTKAALFAEVLELVDRKIITDRGVVARMLSLPDVEEERGLETADIDMVDKTVSLILRGKDYPDPDRRMNLPLAYDRTRKHYLKARIDGIPDEKVQALDEYLTKIEQLLTAAQAEQQAQAEAAQPPPQEAPQGAPPAAPPEETANG